MKRFLILATALMMALSASAHGSTNKVENNGQEQLQPGIYWEKGTLMQALEKAKKEGDKMVFLDCYASWCGPCKYMAGTVFTTKEAGDYFNKKFVNIKIDMEKGEYGDAIHHVQRARNIIVELQSTLDFKYPVAKDFDIIYTYYV